MNRINRKFPTAPLVMFSLTLLGTFDADAQGLIWSISYTDYVGAEAGAGPVGNRAIGFDHVSDSDTTTPPSLNPVSGIFSMSISTNDAGRTFFANALNTPGFAGFVAGLTDGANDYIRLQELGPTEWGIGSEASVLGRSPAAPDFAGYNITQIGFRVNEYYDWYYAPEDSWQNTLNYSLDFYGAPVSLPILKIRRSGVDVILSWPSSFSDFTLQHTSALATTNWSNLAGSVQEDGTNRTVTVSAPTGIQFYRLFKP